MPGASQEDFFVTNHPHYFITDTVAKRHAL